MKKEKREKMIVSKRRRKRKRKRKNIKKRERKKRKEKKRKREKEKKKRNLFSPNYDHEFLSKKKSEINLLDFLRFFRDNKSIRFFSIFSRP